MRLPPQQTKAGTFACTMADPTRWSNGAPTNVNNETELEVVQIMMSRTRMSALIAATAALGLTVAACSSESGDSAGSEPSEGTLATESVVHETTAADAHEGHGEHGGHDEHGDHDHPADGGPAPEGMVEASNPTYPVGTEVILDADHMPGMKGAKATVVGAFDDTYTYAISYDPTDGGERVTNHKWVVQQELEDAGTDRLADGTEKVVTAEHMNGMKGGHATIDSSTDETVYMVDVDADGMTMKNHKWVVESEIKPAN